MNGRLILRVVADEFLLPPEFLKGEVIKDELIQEEDVIYNAVCTYCYVCTLPEVRKKYEALEWSLRGCRNLIKISENQFRDRVRYYREVLQKYTIHKRHLRNIIKSINKNSHV